MRWAGSYSSMASRSSRPAGSRFGTNLEVGSRRHLGKEVLKSGKVVTPGQVFSSGVPRSLAREEAFSIRMSVRNRNDGGEEGNTHLKILKISSISESPGKSGLRVHISAKMAPTDHISTPVEYWRPPKR